MKKSTWTLTAIVLAAVFIAGCMNGEDDSAKNYAPITNLSGTWAERSVPVPFAGRIDTFSVEGSSVRMHSYLWSDVIICTEEGKCDDRTGMRYFSGHYVLEDSLLVFRLVPCDSTYAQIPGTDTTTYMLVSEGQTLDGGKLKLRRSGRSFIFDRI